MKVYIIYDRYECNEFFSIYSICKTFKQFKEVYKGDIQSFLEMGPDDCHTFIGQEINITKEQLQILENYMEDEDNDDGTGFSLMEELYEQSNDDNCLFVIDNSVNYDVFDHYMLMEHPEVDEDTEEWDEYQEEFYDDNNLYETELEKYINDNF